MLSSLFARRQARPTSFRPCLEVLEGRDVPSTLTVTNTLDSGKGSLRYEISHAHKNDTVVFAPSLNGQTIHLTSGELLIQQNLTINGPGASQLTIDANYSSRVFEVAAKAQVALYGLTVSRGEADRGGGILNNGTLTLSGCTLSGNEVIGSGTFGGGICNSGGTLTVSGCTLSDNYAIGTGASGGGLANINAGTAVGTVTILQSTLTGNSAANDGGGIFNAGRLTLTGSTLTGNSVDFTSGDGGAIFEGLGGTLTVSGSTLTGNEAYRGGGIFIAGGTVTVSGCTLSDNFSSSGLGRTICNVGGTLTISNSAFPDNTPTWNQIYGSWIDGGGNTFG